MNLRLLQEMLAHVVGQVETILEETTSPFMMTVILTAFAAGIIVMAMHLL